MPFFHVPRLLPAALIVGFYWAAFALVTYVFFPLQNYVAPDIAAYACLAFLPHGVRVIATWLYREKALIPLLLAHLVLYRLFYWHGDSAAANMVAVLSGTFCSFLAFQLFNFSRIDISLDNVDISHWRSLIFMGFVASIFNTSGNMLALGGAMDNELHLSVILTFIIGDTLGTVICLFILMLGFRLYRLKQTY